MKLINEFSVIDLKNKKLDAFQVFFRENYSHFVRFAEKIVFDSQTAEDIVQDLFVHLWVNAEKISIDVSLKSYIYRSVQNRCVNKLKELQVNDKRLQIYCEDIALITESQEVEYQKKETNIEKALIELPRKMMEIVQLKYLENKKIKEIAIQLSISENTVKTQLFRAKQKLRQILTAVLLFVFLGHP